MSNLPKLGLGKLPTGGGWAVGPDGPVAYLPPTQDQLGKQVYHVKDDKNQDDEKMRASIQSVASVTEDIEELANSPAPMSLKFSTPTENPSSHQKPFIRPLPLASENDAPVGNDGAHDNSLDNTVSQDLEEGVDHWEPGQVVSTTNLGLPINSTLVHNGVVWVAAGDGPLLQFSTEGSDLRQIEQPYLRDITHVRCMCLVVDVEVNVSKLTTTKHEKSSSAPVSQQQQRECTLWCGHDNGDITIIDLWFGKVVTQLRRAHSHRITSIVALPTGTIWTSATSPGDGTSPSEIRIWDKGSRKCLSTKPTPLAFSELCVLPNDRQVWAASPADRFVRVFDFSGKEVRVNPSSTAGDAAQRFPLPENSTRVWSLTHHRPTNTIWMCCEGRIFVYDCQSKHGMKHVTSERLPVLISTLEVNTKAIDFVGENRAFCIEGTPEDNVLLFLTIEVRDGEHGFHVDIMETSHYYGALSECPPRVLESKNLAIVCHGAEDLSEAECSLMTLVPTEKMEPLGSWGIPAHIVEQVRNMQQQQQEQERKQESPTKTANDEPAKQSDAEDRHTAEDEHAAPHPALEPKPLEEENQPMREPTPTLAVPKNDQPRRASKSREPNHHHHHHHSDEQHVALFGRFLQSNQDQMREWTLLHNEAMRSAAQLQLPPIEEKQETTTSLHQHQFSTPQVQQTAAVLRHLVATIKHQKEGSKSTSAQDSPSSATKVEWLLFQQRRDHNRMLQEQRNMHVRQVQSLETHHKELLERHRTLLQAWNSLFPVVGVASPTEFNSDQFIDSHSTTKEVLASADCLRRALYDATRHATGLHFTDSHTDGSNSPLQPPDTVRTPSMKLGEGPGHAIVINATQSTRLRASARRMEGEIPSVLSDLNQRILDLNTETFDNVLVATCAYAPLYARLNLEGTRLALLDWLPNICNVDNDRDPRRQKLFASERAALEGDLAVSLGRALPAHKELMCGHLTIASVEAMFPLDDGTKLLRRLVCGLAAWLISSLVSVHQLVDSNPTLKEIERRLSELERSYDELHCALSWTEALFVPDADGINPLGVLVSEQRTTLEISVKMDEKRDELLASIGLSDESNRHALQDLADKAHRLRSNLDNVKRRCEAAHREGEGLDENDRSASDFVCKKLKADFSHMPRVIQRAMQTILEE